MKIGFTCGCLLLLWRDEAGNERAGVECCSMHERARDWGVEGKKVSSLALAETTQHNAHPVGKGRFEPLQLTEGDTPQRIVVTIESRTNDGATKYSRLVMAPLELTPLDVAVPATLHVQAFVQKDGHYPLQYDEDARPKARAQRKVKATVKPTAAKGDRSLV